MKYSTFASTAHQVVTSLLLGALIAGCQTAPPADTPSTPSAVGTFTGQDLPEKIEELKGTPLYSISEELSSVAEIPGAAFLLIAPQDPTKALLVVEQETLPADLAKRASKPIALSGKKESKKSESLAAHVKERYELELKSDANGDIIVLMVQPQVSDKAEVVEEGSDVDQK